MKQNYEGQSQNEQKYNNFMGDEKKGRGAEIQLQPDPTSVEDDNDNDDDFEEPEE
jgi:hypothetical protein